MSVTADDVRGRLARLGVACEGSDALPTAAPGDEDELAELLRLAARERLRVVPVGLGGKLAWCRPEALEGGADLALSTRALDAVTDYVPGDGTLTAQAGCTMARLAAVVREGGHRLTPDVPRPAEATLGGVLAAGQSGPDRHGLGPARHHVLGMRVVLADGTRAKSGGKLVKNVTGFDLHRLYAGSRGTLCVVVEASLRLFPLPEHERLLSANRADGRAALEAAHAVDASATHPLALTVENHSGSWRVHVALAGRTAQVAREREAVLAVLGDAEEREGEEAAARSAELRDALLADGIVTNGAWPHLRLASRPSLAVAALTTLERFAADMGGTARVTGQPGVATLDAHLDPLASESPERVVERLRALARELPEGARVEPRALPAAVHAALARRERETPELAWTRALAQRLDPEGVLASTSFPPPRVSPTPRDPTP